MITLSGIPYEVVRVGGSGGPYAYYLIKKLHSQEYAVIVLDRRYEYNMKGLSNAGHLKYSYCLTPGEVIWDDTPDIHWFKTTGSLMQTMNVLIDTCNYYSGYKVLHEKVCKLFK